MKRNDRVTWIPQPRKVATGIVLAVSTPKLPGEPRVVLVRHAVSGYAEWLSAHSLDTDWRAPWRLR